MQEDVRLPPHAALLLSTHGKEFDASGAMQAEAADLGDDSDDTISPGIIRA